MLRSKILILLAVAYVFGDGHEGGGHDEDMDSRERRGEAICRIEPDTGMEDEAVEGTIIFSKEDEGVRINVDLRGFDTDNEHMRHGLHIHNVADMGDNCRNAGPHFNPYNVYHGGPMDSERHVGDLGNIEEDGEGRVHAEMLDTSGLIEFEGEHSIIGRSVVVHETEDDLGRGPNEESRRTGNAGGRLGCCIIMEVEVDHASGSVRHHAGLFMALLVGMVTALFL